jgi:hypothetical protein
MKTFSSKRRRRVKTKKKARRRVLKKKQQGGTIPKGVLFQDSYLQDPKGVLFQDSYLQDYMRKLNTTFPEKKVFNYEHFKKNRETMDIRSICSEEFSDYLSYFFETGDIEDSYNPNDRKIDLIYMVYPGTKQISSILIALLGECTEYPDVWSIALICNNLPTNASILVGAYCYCLKKKGHAKGLLELAGSYENISAYCLYSKFGFVKAADELECSSFVDERHLPMTIDFTNISDADIIDTVIMNSKIRNKKQFDKPKECIRPVSRPDEDEDEVDL